MDGDYVCSDWLEHVKRVAFLPIDRASNQVTFDSGGALGILAGRKGGGVVGPEIETQTLTFRAPFQTNKVS